MLELKLSWVDAGPVRDPLLKRTWCQLQILANGNTVTRFSSPASESVRDCVFLSAFPLASWLVKNWFSLVSESTAQTLIVEGGRRAYEKAPELQRWLGRHCILYGREGMRLPDLSLFRDGQFVRAVWRSDPSAQDGEFIATGSEYLDREKSVDNLRRFVDAVRERVQTDEKARETDAACEFLADWDAVSKLSLEETTLAFQTGAIGIDPFGEEADEKLLELLRRSGSLGFGMAEELLAVTSARHLHDDLTATETFQKQATELVKAPASFTQQAVGQGSAHIFGYRLAQKLRLEQGLAQKPIDDLEKMLAGRLNGWLSAEAAGTRRVRALALTGDEIGLVGETPDTCTTGRFLLGRAAFMWEIGRTGLLTSGHNWHQRASRAFAAELLAPQAALFAEADGAATGDVVRELARHYSVSDWVIAHQLENRGVTIGD